EIVAECSTSERCGIRGIHTRGTARGRIAEHLPNVRQRIAAGLFAEQLLNDRIQHLIGIAGGICRLIGHNYDTLWIYGDMARHERRALGPLARASHDRAALSITTPVLFLPLRLRHRTRRVWCRSSLTPIRLMRLRYGTDGRQPSDAWAKPNA